ncbi:MAG: FtsX-like permease family protein [Rhodanobacter sp.]
MMNIMLANVFERRRKVGLLHAIAARRQDIVQRFLREAMMTCASGALIGLLFGAALACAIAAFVGWKVAWAPARGNASVLACIVTGLHVSIYPARQVVAFDPIAAIRHE